MQNLLNRSKPEEFESNSALQIRNQKERKAEKAGKSSSFVEGCKNFTLAKFAQCEFFTRCEIPHSMKFLHCAKFSHSAKIILHFISHNAKMLLHFLDFLPFSPSFDFPFVIFFSNFALHVLWVLRVFLYFCLFEHYISSNQIL